jgi:hypothetical protein
MVKTIDMFVSIALAFFSSYVFMRLFNWFPSEIFGVHPLNYAEAFGLALFLGYITMKATKAQFETSDEEKLTLTLTMVVANLFMLGAGAIVHSFM